MMYSRSQEGILIEHLERFAAENTIQPEEATNSTFRRAIRDEIMRIKARRAKKTVFPQLDLGSPRLEFFFSPEERARAIGKLVIPRAPPPVTGVNTSFNVVFCDEPSADSDYQQTIGKIEVGLSESAVHIAYGPAGFRRRPYRRVSFDFLYDSQQANGDDAMIGAAVLTLLGRYNNELS